MSISCRQNGEKGEGNGGGKEAALWCDEGSSECATAAAAPASWLEDWKIGAKTREGRATATRLLWKITLEILQ